MYAGHLAEHKGYRTPRLQVAATHAGRARSWPSSATGLRSSDDTDELAVAARPGDDGGALAAAARMPQLGFRPHKDKKRELRLELERLRDDFASTTQTAATTCNRVYHRVTVKGGGAAPPASPSMRLADAD